MSRLIDADELKDHQFHGLYTNIHIASNTDAYMLGWNDAIDAIVKCAPTVDAEPVKHGHWVEENTRTHSMQFKCSVCGRIAYYPQNHHSTEPKRCGYAYCPNCGARMDGGEDDADE